MQTLIKENNLTVKNGAHERSISKDQILSLYLSGMTEIEDLTIITGSRPSYVGSVLQEAGMKPGYFDLYTSTQHPMNVYSKFFANKLGFKDEEAARKSVELIEHLYRQFETGQDRAGQHHALVDTNITGTIYLLKKVGSDMRTRGQWRILIVGSIAGFIPGTYQAVYNGTKAFLDSFSFALRAELKDTGVTVTCLMPGATETDFFKRADMLDTKVGQSKKDDPG